MSGLAIAAAAEKSSITAPNADKVTALTTDTLKTGTSISYLPVDDLILDACGARIGQPNVVGDTLLTDARIEAGLVDPKLIEAPVSNNLPSEQMPVADGQGLENVNVKNTSEFKIRETPDEVQVCDRNGNVLASIRPDEYATLQEAGLKPQMVNGRVCFIRSDIDLDFKDALGNTNRERIELKQVPLDAKTGRIIDLHHVGQNPDGPLAELRMDEHRTGPNNLKLHPLRDGSEVEHDGEWSKIRADHWKSRIETMEALA